LAAGPSRSAGDRTQASHVNENGPLPHRVGPLSLLDWFASSQAAAGRRILRAKLDPIRRWAHSRLTAISWRIEPGSILGVHQFLRRPQLDAAKALAPALSFLSPSRHRPLSTVVRPALSPLLARSAEEEGRHPLGLPEVLLATAYWKPLCSLKPAFDGGGFRLSGGLVVRSFDGAPSPPRITGCARHPCWRYEGSHHVLGCGCPLDFELGMACGILATS